jgi:3-methyladenine DNA glycosylase/8-oxoguanine DNA glycosylase
VEMLLISRLGRPDVLPVGDFAVRKGFQLTYDLEGRPKPRALKTGCVMCVRSDLAPMLDAKF